MVPLRVIVFGYGELALAAIDTLTGLGVVPLAVVVPGNRTGSDVELVSAEARRRGLPVIVQPPRSQRLPFIAAIAALRPDLLFVWSYSMLLPPDLLAIAPRGAVNVHGGLLPQYRGGHVMNWAIANGERETGVTLAYLDGGIDTGPVIGQRRFAIEPGDDAASVRTKLKITGVAMIQEWWPAIADGSAPAVAQDESQARYYRMRTAEDGKIDWARSSTDVVNLVRALVSPWPGAFFMSGETRLVVRRAAAAGEGASATPGTVVGFDDDTVRVATGHGDVRLSGLELDGRAAHLADLRALGITEGSRLAAS